MSFKVGDRVVYPHHGAAVVKKKEIREAFGEKTEYLVLQMAHGDMMLSVPSEKAEDVGMRWPISTEDVEVTIDLCVESEGILDLKSKGEALRI